jgi:ATP-grasp domain, R2K clade family 3
MKLLFCRNPEMKKLPDPVFEDEFEAAKESGFSCLLFGLDDFLARRSEQAFVQLPAGQGETLLYRGWMMTEGEYRRLESACSERGYRLFTPASAYAEALYLPRHFSKLSELAPPTVWIEGTSLDEAWRCARTLGHGPWIVKDFIKSAKQRWHEACFIPERVERSRFDEILQNFLSYRGENFAGGLVFKQYIPLRKIGDDAFGGPQCEEYRLFYWKQKLLVASPYSRFEGEVPDLERYTRIAQKLQSQFVTIDVARTQTGDWLLLEIGAGEVSALSPLLSPLAFYRALSASETGL